MKAPAAVLTDADQSDPLRLRLAGRLTTAEVGELHAVAAAALRRHAHLTVDCSAVERVDAAAAQLLLALRRDAGRSGLRCELTGLSGDVSRSLRAAGVWDGLTA